MKKNILVMMFTLMLIGLLIPTALATSTIRESYHQTGGLSVSTIYGANWGGQSFKVTGGVDYMVDMIKIYACKSASSPNTMTIHIRATESGADLTTGTFNANTMTTYPTMGWYSVNITPYTLSEGVTYWIIIDCATASGTDSVYWGHDSVSSTYADGVGETSSNSGSTWTTISGGVIDFWFEVWASDSSYITSSHYPNDTNLIQNVNYNFCFTTYISAVPTSGYLFNIDINGVSIGNYTSGTSGIKYIILYFLTIGSKNMTLTLYNSYHNETIYTGSTVYNIILPSGVVTVEQQSQLLMSSALALLPLLICIMLPAYFGGKAGGMVGYALGALVGVSVAIGANLLPFYYVYLIGLLLIMAFVFVIRGSGGISGGGSSK